MNANEQLLYALQEKTVLSQQQELPSMLGQPDCVDAWRQRRIYELIQPIVAYGIEGRWLTIGDSGSDATVLAESGIAPSRIVASSLCTAQLERLADRGYLSGPDLPYELGEVRRGLGQVAAR